MFTRKSPPQTAKAFVGFLTVVACSGSAANAGSPATSPLSVRMSLATSQTVSLGEPVVIHYEFANLSPSQHLILTDGLPNGGWYTISLTGAGGSAVAIKPSRRVSRRSGLFQDSSVGIVHSGKVEGDIVVATSRTLTRPGKYTLNLHAHLPYATEPDVSVDADPDTHLTLNQSYVMPFTVTAPDSDRLHRTAEGLRQEAESAEFSGRGSSIVEALFSMPEGEALPSWQALVSNPHVPERVLREAVDQLTRLRSPAAVDLLAQLYWNPAQPPGGISWAEIGQHIAEIYNSEMPLKDHIRKLFAKHGVQLSDMMPEKSQPN